MTIELKVEVGDGIEWSVTSDSWQHDVPAIIIPIDTISELPNELIGYYARNLIEQAQYAKALRVADWLLQNGTRTMPLRVLEDYQDDIQLLMSFEGVDDSIDRAIAGIREAQQRAAKKPKAKARTQKVRRELSKKYTETFVALGRRDRFACAQCGSATDDLQIDHVVPVSKGGTNELDNLQLLCRSCNAAKGANLP